MADGHEKVADMYIEMEKLDKKAAEALLEEAGDKVRGDFIRIVREAIARKKPRQPPA